MLQFCFLDLVILKVKSKDQTHFIWLNKLQLLPMYNQYVIKH